MHWFHVTMHGRPAGLAAGPIAAIGDLRLPTLAVPPELATEPLSIGFDSAAASLSALERLFFEPDGSWVWVGSGPPPWQLDGLLCDRGDRLSHVELKGTCPRAEMTRLLDALGGDGAGGEAARMFQSVREAIFLDEAGFLALAGGEVGSRRSEVGKSGVV